MKNHMKRRLSLLLVLMLLASLAPSALAADGCRLTVSAPAAAEIDSGSQFSLDLSTVFADSEGHALTYTVANDSGNRATTNLKGGVYYFTSPEAGSFAPTITARCADGRTARVTLSIEVRMGKIDNPGQYNYDETPASSVEVYVTISNDGLPVLGSDGELLSHIKVRVPYFDLGRYGLEDFYRYATENGYGPYVGDKVIERPTAMHLFLYMLERYYLGCPAEECGTGQHVDELFGPCRNDEVMVMYDVLGYEARMSPLTYTGGACSTYMQSFWGHDENLMYYRNHQYPLQSPGWGSTADYILLSDGDTIDLAMFSDWGFYQHGAFCAVAEGDGMTPVETITAGQGEKVRIRGIKFGTQSVTEGGTDVFAPVAEDEIMFFCYNDALEDAAAVEPVIDAKEGFTGMYEFDTTGMEPGTYRLFGLDMNSGDPENACIAPAVCDVIIKAAGEEDLPGDVNGDGEISILDAGLVIQHSNGMTVLTEAQLAAADVNGDGEVNIMDAGLLIQYSGGMIKEFPKN